MTPPAPALKARPTRADHGGVGWADAAKVRATAWQALRRDRLSRASADEGRQLELCRYMLWLRHVAVSLGLVVGLRADGLGRAERLTLALLLAQVTAHVVSSRAPRRAGLVAVADALLFLLLTALGLHPALVFIVAVAILGWAATFRPAQAIASYVAVLLAVALMVAAHESIPATPTVGAFCLLGGIFMLRTIRLNIGARRASEREHLVAERVDAILWEQLPGRTAFKVSPAAERVLGYPVTDWATPGFWRSVVHPDDLDSCGLDAVGQLPDNPALLRVRHRDGGWRWVENRVTSVQDRQGRPAFLVGVLIDVSERVESGRQLHLQARQDELTGMPNRRAFLESLEARLSDPGDEPTALLILDLDDFKEINDSLGHHTGDELLRSVADRIRAGARDGEIVARLGGDEFAVILPGLPAAEVTERGRLLAEAINAPVLVGDLRLRVRASIGIAVHPADAADAGELMARADIAMYQAKSHGSGPVRYDAALDLFGRERVTLVGDLDMAITSGQLVLHHQPLFDVASGRVLGTEALVRWNHPRLGLLPPAKFIELAEVSGQIKPLTRWVIRQALTDLQTLGDPWSELEVSINLSVRNLYEADLVPWLVDTLAALQVDARRLVVEITESTIMVDYPAAVEMIEALRALGVRTWIDDFGTGHSSLARLRNLPVDGVKIDRSFVGGVAHSPRDRNILHSLIELVDSLGMQTLAEGVERAECLQVLRALGCRAAQGFYLGRPVPAATLAASFGAGATAAAGAGCGEQVAALPAPGSL